MQEGAPPEELTQDFGFSPGVSGRSRRPRASRGRPGRPWVSGGPGHPKS